MFSFSTCLKRWKIVTTSNWLLINYILPFKQCSEAIGVRVQKFFISTFFSFYHSSVRQYCQNFVIFYHKSQYFSTQSIYSVKVTYSLIKSKIFWSMTFQNDMNVALAKKHKFWALTFTIKSVRRNAWSLYSKQKFKVHRDSFS